MKLFKNALWIPKCKNLWGLPISVLSICAMGLFASCDSSKLNPPSNDAMGTAPKSDDSVFSASYHFPAFLAKEEVIRYNTFLNNIAGKLGADSMKIPRYFTVSNTDFFETMGIDSITRAKLNLKFTHSRLYISLDNSNNLHLLFTPVNRAKLGTWCDASPTYGEDTVRKSTLLYPACSVAVNRYGGQQVVDRFFGTSHNKRMLKDNEPVLYDMSGPCPPCGSFCGDACSTSFINQKF